MDTGNHQNRGHDPPTHPNLFLVEPEFDQDRLDEEYRRNRQLVIGEGYIGEEDLGDEDPAVIEANYQAWAASEEGQQAWLEAEQQRQLEEKLSVENPFFMNAPASHDVSAQSPYASKFIPQKIVPPEQKPNPEFQSEPVKLPIHTEKPPTPYDLTQWLINNSALVHAEGTIYIFNGKYYAPCQTAEIDRYIVEHCRGSVQRAGTESYVRQVRRMLLLEPRICRDTDLQCNVVAFDDCLLDLDKWETRPHSPSIFVTTRLNASFERGKNSTCPVFQQMLERISGDDASLQQRIWEVIGYLLAPDQAGKSFILFQGVPNSGKSVLGKFLKGCFPKDAISALELNDLGGRFDMADLVGKKLCLDLDLPANPFKPRAISNLKKLTGGDTLSTDVKYADRVTFCNTAKLLFGTNHAVLIPSEDAAFFNRMVVVPFARSIRKQDQNPRLPDLLATERDSIIVRALGAYRELKEQNYCFAGSYQANVVGGLDGETALDKVANFLQNSCQIDPTAWTSSDCLFARFVELYGNCCGRKKFSAILNNLCKTQELPVLHDRDRTKTSSNSIWGFRGLKLRGEHQ